MTKTNNKTPEQLKVGLIQQLGQMQKEKSLALSREGVAQACQKGAQLIVLQELHAGLYFCQSEDTVQFDLAEPIPGPSSQFLSDLAREFQVVLVGSLFEKRAPGIYHNTAVVFEKDGTLVGKYRKMHIPDDPGFYEKFYFTPGDLGFRPIKTSVGNLGVLVCWDQWFPEAARLMALAGADLLIYPTAIGWDPQDPPEEKSRQLDAWVTIQRSHAVANGLPVVVCNRVGHESPSPSFSQNQGAGIQFWGHSFVAGPQGEILCTGSQEAPQVLVSALDLRRTEDVRRIWPFFRDRRIDAYEDLMKRYLDKT